jgi:hypothetical protein
MIRQMRRYELIPEVQDEFLEWWQNIPAAREPFGFRVLSAHIDREAHEFTWLVERDGDMDAFLAAEEAWFGSKERAALFAGQAPHTVAIHVSFVDQIF